MTERAKRFLIVHLIANGDCLMVTTIAKQIKFDNPNCHLTWAISYKCKQVIENNPYVDSIWEVSHDPKENLIARNGFWDKLKQEAEERKAKGEFDEIIYSQLQPDNIHHFDGTTRSSTFRAYPKPITVDVTPVMNLCDDEVTHVKDFVIKNKLESYKHIILCECTPGSGQSSMNLLLMLHIAGNIIEERKDAIFIISTHLKIDSSFGDRIIDASTLSYRENAELSKYCTFLVGCSSGITWLLTSSWAKKINTVQFLQNGELPFSFASLAYDLAYWDLPTNHILETDASELGMMQNIVIDSIIDFDSAKKKYNIEFKPKLLHLAKAVKYILSKDKLNGVRKSFFCIGVYFKRNKYKSIAIFNLFYLIAILCFQKKGYAIFNKRNQSNNCSIGKL